MQTSHVQRQIKALAMLRKEMRARKHTGEGLGESITIGAGPRTISLTLTNDLQDEVLESIEAALLATLRLSRFIRLSELKDLQADLAALDALLGPTPA